MSTVTTTTNFALLQEQTVQKLIATNDQQTKNIGEAVTDISNSLYAASKEIGFAAWNMRPNHVHHIFFDGINVDQYCAPGVYSATGSTTGGPTVLRNGEYGTTITSDALGVIQGVFRIPDRTFKTGDRVLEIADVSDLNLGEDSIVSKAMGTYTSSNISVTKKMITLTTMNPILTVQTTNPQQTVIDPKVTVRENVVDQTIYNIVYGWYEPIAQGLTINTPGNQAGIFATKLDLYFKQKTLTSGNGVTIYLCEINNGYPNGNAILPYSQVWLPASSINVSETGTVATTFTFDAPVFMANGTEYAFIVRPDSNDPDYQVFSAKLGDVDLATLGQVSSIPLVGSAFYGSTMTQWTALQTEYIKFILHRAVFDTTAGVAKFNNSDAEYIKLQNVTYSNPSNSIKPGYYVFNSANEVSNSIGGSVNTSTYATITNFSSNALGMYLENSTGNFPTGNAFVQIHSLKTNANGSVILQPNNLTIIAYGNTYPIWNPILNAVVPQFSTMTPAGTSLNYSFKGTGNSYSVDSSYTDVTLGYENELLDYERRVVSKSNEAAHMSGAKSTEFKAAMVTDSSFVSPVIDTTMSSQLALANQIDPICSVYEEFFSSSPTKSKYVSKVVTLAPGQDAQDLHITISAHKPPSTQIQVWVKYLNGEDSESMAQKTWTPMRDLASSVYCNPLDHNDIKEFTYSTPYRYPMIPAVGTVTANSVLGTTVSGDGTTTTFGTDVNVGFYVNMAANSTWQESSRQVVSITDANTLILNAPFTNNYSSNTLYIVPPPTTAWLSTNNTITLTGTVTTNTLNNIVTGSSTNFTGQLVPGSVLSINGDDQQVVSVTNSTSLTVGTPWSSYVTGATGYVVKPAGLTYYNSSNTIYSTFNQFQIKLVLMSNDTSKVPIIDDLRALALQL